MPLQTNLNVSPYFDDFQADNDFAKVLFKPGYPVQARELTSLQSILQNQIEKFGKHFFKEGAKVIPGNIGYNQLYYGVQLNNNYQGVPVSAYVDQLVGARIRGSNSGVTAIVDRVLRPEESERGTLTLYVNYLSSNTKNNTNKEFDDGEELTSNVTILSGLLGNSTIEPGTPFASTFPSRASITGASFNIDEGVYFFHGQFVNVNKETILLDQYTNRSNYRVGLFVTEEIINADVDPTLNDNSQGFNNYAAPGADRLKITAGLYKKRLGDYTDDAGGQPSPAPSPVVNPADVPTTTTAANNANIDATGDVYNTTNTTNVINVNILQQQINNQNTTQVTNVTIQAPTNGGGYFVELAQVQDGNITSVKKPADDYNSNFLEILARRTYAESGDYYVKPFTVNLKNSFNNGMGSRGVYKAGQITSGGSTPSDDLALYQISPGKAFVRGWEIETVNSSFLDCDKPRSTKIIKDQAIQYNTGPTLTVNNVFRSPTIGIGNTYTLSLRDKRVPPTKGVVSAYGDVKMPNGTVGSKEIGVARLYDMRLESGSYDLSNSNVNKWDLSLYDVQTTTDITVNDGVTLSVPTYVTGSHSGATAFLKDAVSAGTAITCYEVTGNFIPNETLSFDSITEGRIAIAVTAHSLSDVESVVGTNNGTVGINTFTADVVPQTIFPVGIVTISAGRYGGTGTLGISTAYKSGNQKWLSIGKKDMLCSFSNPEFTDRSYAIINTVGDTNTITITGVATVTGFAQGQLPTNNIEVTDFKFEGSPIAPSQDNTLYTTLPKKNIATVDLTDSYITIRKTFEVDISNNQFSAQVESGLNETFEPFDDERYTLIRSDGTTEVLTSDKMSLTGGGTLLQFFDLGSADTGSQLVATLRKNKPTIKQKIRERVNSIVVDKSNNGASGIGTTTLQDGLVFGTYPFGTRVQDKEISLNFPDIIKIHAIYESSNTSDPQCPKMTLTAIQSLSATTSEMVIGEQITGQSSDAIAIVSEKLDDLNIGYITKNETLFTEGETIIGAESGTEGVIQTLVEPSFNVTAGYDYRRGQESTFWDYGKIVRKEVTEIPDRKIKIYFENAKYESTDTGDIVTVDSYSTFPYESIGMVNGVSNTDMIDIRPRVGPYTVAESVRSPLEFWGRNFNVTGQNPPNVLASDEALQTTYSFFLGRIDRIFLTKSGNFIVKYGTPAEKPERPGPVDDALEICQVTLPPYLYTPEQAILDFMKHKRFQMKDIKVLEDRIRNLEYYTTLSLLEVNTANMFVPDADGLNRFKSGLYVDNFTSFMSQEYLSGGIKNSIDRERKETRPRHFTSEIKLMFGPVTNRDDLQDDGTSTVEGNNVRKMNDILMLDFTEVEYINQAFATRTESVTPFLISFWNGTLELTPSSDTWMDQVRLEPKVTKQEGNFAETMKRAQENEGVDPQTGMGPTVWGAWEENWTGARWDIVKTESRVEESGWRGQGPGGRSRQYIGDLVTETIQDITREKVEMGVKNRTGSRTVVTEQWDTINIGDKVVSRDLVPYMRSRNISINAKKMKPNTRLHAFMDGVDVTQWCTPKLLSVSMQSGTFQVGERTSCKVQYAHGPHMHFRVAALNHKAGHYQFPTETYRENPYTNQPLGSSYSSNTDIVNIDLLSLQEQSRGTYWGWVIAGMKIIGLQSGAEGTILSTDLVTSISADLQASFLIPDYTRHPQSPKFECGTKVLTLINDKDNNQNFATTISEESYTASGTIENVQEQIISVRNARVETKMEFSSEFVEKASGLMKTDSTSINKEVQKNVVVGWYDPLAQSFLVDDSNGVFVTSCDIFFSSKDDNDIPMVFQLRTMEAGMPTQHILPFSEIVVDPDRIRTSSDGSVATNIKFKAPVYLEGSREYAIALASNSTKYSVYVSRVGETDILTQTYISNQPYLGSMFKSQNASTWEPSQWEDLKFKIYRADFLESGSVELYNSPLATGNKQIARLMPNSLNIVSRQVRVGLGTTVADTALKLGRKISQDASGTDLANGVLIGVAGKAEGTMSVANAGIGYTPADGSRTVAGVNLVTVSGAGRGAVASVYVKDGVVGTATITSGGSGYIVGDVVGFTTLGVNSVGRDCRLSIVSIGQTSELVVNNVQGNFSVGAAKTIMLTNAAGNTNALNAGYGGDVQISSIVEINTGTNIKVDHKNHGMYFDDNTVNIAHALPDIKPTRLTGNISKTQTTISVEDASIFTTFEGVGIGTTNFGYIQVGDGDDVEIMSIDSVNGNNIGISTRSIDGSDEGNIGSVEWDSGTPIYKYELGGVSLRRINKLHYLGDADVANAIGFDYYNLKIDMSGGTGSRGSSARDGTGGWPKLYFNSSKSTGGSDIHASQNMPFEVITPMAQNLTIRGTSLTGEMRTTTSKSMSGTEIPWVDNGYESVSLNESNYMTTPRLIGSEVNEERKLTNQPGNKSLNLRLFLNSTNSFLSPMVDSQRLSVITTSNRVNEIITDYATDPRVGGIENDPTACQYISKEISLENPATSLKILVDAYINTECDIRAFYYISNKEGLNPVFTPFPGFKNLNKATGAVIAAKDNNGQPDKFITPSNTYGFEAGDLDYAEYSFTADDLPSYRTYRVKIVLTSTNQVYVPRMKDLRVMALA